MHLTLPDIVKLDYFVIVALDATILYANRLSRQAR